MARAQGMQNAPRWSDERDELVAMLPAGTDHFGERRRLAMRRAMNPPSPQGRAPHSRGHLPRPSPQERLPEPWDASSGRSQGCLSHLYMPHGLRSANVSARRQRGVWPKSGAFPCPQSRSDLQKCASRPLATLRTNCQPQSSRYEQGVPRPHRYTKGRQGPRPVAFRARSRCPRSGSAEARSQLPV